MNLPTILINELYDEVTYQGEGPFIGRPCFFLRTQGCPVRCRGTREGDICDSYFTWDGSEIGTRFEVEKIVAWAREKITRYPRAGIVVTGGEPLIHYKNQTFIDLLRAIPGSWLSLETSGYIGPKQLTREDGLKLFTFLDHFKSTSLSPKITPCLHGDGISDDDLLVNVPNLLERLEMYEDDKVVPEYNCLKFVCRDQDDIDAVDRFFDRFKTTLPVYIMPYGVEAEEVVETSKRLLPAIAERGWILSPRLHTMLWGKKRGV